MQITDHQQLCRAIEQMQREQNAEISVLTRSILGKEIPIISLGQGVRTVVYVGGVCGTHAITTDVLVQFLRDYFTSLARRATLYGVSMEYFHSVRRVCVIPMLNPDGIEYATHGIAADHPMRARVLQMNGANGADFSAWEANARGVDLRHNFKAGFFSHKEKEQREGLLNGAASGYGGEHPESEPEISALCRFLRLRQQDLIGVLCLQAGTAQINCCCADHLSAKSMAAGRSLARLSGIRLTSPDSLKPEGGIGEWCIRELHRPAYTLSFASKGAGGVPRDRVAVYEQLRHALCGFPFCL